MLVSNRCASSLTVTVLMRETAVSAPTEPTDTLAIRRALFHELDGVGANASHALLGVLLHLIDHLVELLAMLAPVGQMGIHQCDKSLVMFAL